MSYKVEALPNSHTELGEGPHWNVATQSLYYVDLDEGRLLRYDYRENKVHHCQITGEQHASFIIPIEGENSKFADGCGRRVVVVDWDGKSQTCSIDRTLFEVQTEEQLNGTRFNDGKCDPQGRLFAGTMFFTSDDLFSHRLGQLYKYEKSGQVEVVKSNIGISNGLVWNEYAEKFYYIDSSDFDVKEYDYDFEKGVVSKPKIIYKIQQANPSDLILADGMTIDTEGNIYVAIFNGNAVYKIDPRTSKILLEIKIPCKHVTSVAFGGPELDILYVTTAARFEKTTPAGTLFKVTGLNVKGLPMTSMRI